jgi:uncharacterized repeat protein (TIGR01451 family)
MKNLSGYKKTRRLFTILLATTLIVFCLPSTAAASETQPAIGIVKTTNGEDGGNFSVGTVVTWRYEVTNKGSIPLLNISVTDNKGVIPDYKSGDQNGNGKLDTSETWIYEASGIATAGLYENIGTASGQYYDDQDLKLDDCHDGRHYFKEGWHFVDNKWQHFNSGWHHYDNGWHYDNDNQNEEAEDEDCNHDPVYITVSASDPSSYTGYIPAAPAITLDKLTNGSDGPSVLVGSTVTWTYLVTNTGNVDLYNITVVDDMGTPSNTEDDIQVGTITSLAPQAFQTLTLTGTAIAGPYSNTATVRGELLNSERFVSDSDASNYIGTVLQSAAINVVKSSTTTEVNTIDQNVPYTFTVTNVGNVALTNIIVTDTNLTSGPLFVSGDTNSNGSLDLSEIWIFSGTRVIPQGELQSNGGGDGLIDNTVTVSGTPPQGSAVDDSDTHSIPINLYVQPPRETSVTVAGAMFTVSPVVNKEIVVQGGTFETGDNDTYSFRVIALIILLLSGSMLALWHKKSKKDKKATEDNTIIL